MKACRLALPALLAVAGCVGTVNVTNPTVAVDAQVAATVLAGGSTPASSATASEAIVARAATVMPSADLPSPVSSPKADSGPVATPTPLAVAVTPTPNALICDGIAREMREEMARVDRQSLSIWANSPERYDGDRAQLVKDINDRYALRWLAAGCGPGFPTPNPDPVTPADRRRSPQPLTTTLPTATPAPATVFMGTPTPAPATPMPTRAPFI